ncbi:MAG: alpha/beta hydrolase, partial [Pricia sp.]|nr:alpha/beta hydrolase [Pricia sp.]
MRKFSKEIMAKVYGLYLNVLVLFSKKLAAEKAFQIFSKVRKGQVLSQQYAYLEAAKNEVLNACGHSIQTYRWFGARETVLLV